jgi:hypothetical protein
MGFFADGNAVRRLSKLRVAYGVLFIIAFLGTEFLRLKLRPAVYASGNGPRWFFDTIGNSGGAVTQIFLMLAVMHCSFVQSLRVIGFVVVGYSAYELLQPILPKGTFDINDIIGTVVGGLISLVLILLLRIVFGARPAFAAESDVTPLG